MVEKQTDTNNELHEGIYSINYILQKLSYK